MGAELSIPPPLPPLPLPDAPTTPFPVVLLLTTESIIVRDPLPQLQIPPPDPAEGLPVTPSVVVFSVTMTLVKVRMPPVPMPPPLLGELARPFLRVTPEIETVVRLSIVKIR
jgi:hypothetical protein